MATTRIFLPDCSGSLDPVAYLVRSFQTNARIRSLTTGTFNRVVKDRIALRLSGANSVQANPLLERIRLSSKPYKHTLLPGPCQRKRFTAFPPVFHNGEGGRNSAEAANWGAEISPGLKNSRKKRPRPKRPQLGSGKDATSFGKG